MSNYVKPILKRKPDYVVLHMGTNNTKQLSSTKILDKFRKFINLESLSIHLPVLKTQRTHPALTFCSQIQKTILKKH